MAIEKEIGAQELVYCTITDIIDGKAGNKSIKFKHLSGKEADHAWTTDKNRYKHCYDRLEAGCNYLIVTEHVGPKRWVWKRSWLLTKKELNAVYKHCGLIPTYEELEAALTVITTLRNPPKTPNLDDVLIF